MSLALVFALLQLSVCLVGYENLQADTIIANGSLTGDRNWTASSTWVGGNVPGPNDRAIIPQNLTVLLNGTNHVVKELVVKGTLRAQETAGVNRSLTSNWIHVNSGGVFQVGTATDRYDQAEFTVRLTGDDPNQTFVFETGGCDCGCMGSNLTISNNDSFLMVASDGRLQLSLIHI